MIHNIIQYIGGVCQGNSGIRISSLPETRMQIARWRLRIWDRPSRLFFSPARLADKRTLGPGPLVNHPAPEAKKERLLRLWTPPHPPQVQPHVSLGSVVQFRLNFVISGLQVPCQVSQLESIEIRSTPKVKRSVSDLYSMKVHSENVRSKPNTCAQHLHLGVADKSNTCKQHLWR